MADPVGTYTSTTGSTVTIVIPAGFFDRSPSGTPIAAPAGTYIPVAGATSAAAEIKAPPGTYVAFTGATAATPDPVGTYTSTAGATAPITIPAGYYDPSPSGAPGGGALPGTYVPVTGATSAAAEIEAPATGIDDKGHSQHGADHRSDRVACAGIGRSECACARAGGHLCVIDRCHCADRGACGVLRCRRTGNAAPGPAADYNLEEGAVGGSWQTSL